MRRIPRLAVAMTKRTLAAGALLALGGGTARAQIPTNLEAKLLFRLGTNDAGWETFRIERRPGGTYRLQGEADLQLPGLRIVQRVDLLAGPRLQFIEAHVLATVGGDTTRVSLVREGGYGRQTQVQGSDSTTSQLETPESSVLMTNNVIHHIVQFAWLHDGALDERRDVTAFPRIPVSVTLQDESRVSRNGAALSARRYFLNLANRLGAFVWLAADGTPLKVSVPLQTFEAVNEAYSDWAPLLTPESAPAETAASGPAPFHAEEVEFESGEITLAGTLTTPAGQGPWPAAVLITGSGPQNRDEDTEGPGGLKLGIFRVIADTLTRRGIAVLRYDDRGVGASGGDLGTASLSDLVSDVAAAVRYLRGRREIDNSRIALIGHSEGAIIAPMVAVDDPRVAAVVSLAGTAAPLDSIVMEQVASAAREAGGDSAKIAEARRSIAMLADAVREGRDLEKLDLPPPLKALAGNRAWFLEHIEHDPAATIGRVRAPVLIVNGGQDVQVPPAQAERLGATLAAAGHPDYTVKIFPELNHLFAVSTGQGTAEYADPNARVDREFLGYLAEWLVTRLGTSNSGL